MVLVEKRLVTVAGATGLQGGSVVRYLLHDGTFRVRGMTRNPGSAKAKELQERGVEVVFADFEDPSSVTAALHGTYGVFAVTNYWESMDGEKEIRHGKVLVDAAKANNVQHFIWSTVAIPPKGLEVKHWISKASVNEHLLSSGVPRTSLYTTFYFENFLMFDFGKLKLLAECQSTSGPPTPKYTAKWPLLLTDGPIGGYSVQETGAYALAIFKDPYQWIGKDLYVPPEVFTARTYVDALNDALAGKAVIEMQEIDRTTFEETKKLDDPGIEELWTNNEAFYRAGGKMRNLQPRADSSEGTFMRAEEIEKSILPDRMTLQSWVQTHIDEILAAAL